MFRTQISTECVIVVVGDMKMLSILGFVEDLIVEDDPEFEFEDRFRSSQKSNEKRQKQLYNLSYSALLCLHRRMQLRRHIGKQAQKRGANAVFGYQQFFDMEGDSGIVGRAYGTACVYEPEGCVRE